MVSRRIASGAVAAWLLAGPAAAQVAPASDLAKRIGARLERLEPELIQFRRDLHRHPEVSGEERRTAAAVADRLRRLGIEVETGIAGYGLVAWVRGARPGPVVAYRSDMDAVYSDAPDPVEFRSTIAGVRHICGHDIHTAIGVALAEAFASVRADLLGTLMVIFQPAEERAIGAKAMLRAGLFDRTKPAAILATHTAPLPVGQLGIRAGIMMPGRDFVTVSLKGTGNLERAADSVARVIRSVSTISGGQLLQPAPADFVASEAQVERPGGQGGWSVQGVVTVASAEARARARSTIEKALEKLGLPGVQVETRYQERAIAGITNDSGLVARANTSIRAALGGSAVASFDALIPAFSEDFGSFQDRVPGAFYFLGVANAGKGWNGMPHTPEYVADEAAILVAARAMTAAILGELGR